MHLHNHGRAIYAPWQVADLPFPYIVHLVQAAATSAALKTPVNRLAPHPQLQCLRLFVQFVPVHPITRPRQNRRPFSVRQLKSVPKNAISLNHRYLNVFPNSCGEPHKPSPFPCSANKPVHQIEPTSHPQPLLLGHGIAFEVPRVHFCKVRPLLREVIQCKDRRHRTHWHAGAGSRYIRPDRCRS